jgi:endogenous inhibitor of DNA gyrase (YacG/DUF329 family)
MTNKKDNIGKYATISDNELWYPLRCNLCGKGAQWANEGTGRNYCTQCMEDVAFA